MDWSDDARVMVRPFHTYAEIGALGDDDDASPGRTLALRVGLVLLVIAGFVSLTSAGRLVAFHVASTMVFWSFIPLLQAATFTLAFQLIARPRTTTGLVPALSLYFTGHGPWLLFFLSLAGVCLFAPDVYAAMMWLLSRRLLPLMMLATIVWSGVLTFACFRAGLGLTRGRAAAATALFYVSFSATIIGYYLAMNEIQPQAPWAQR